MRQLHQVVLGWLAVVILSGSPMYAVSNFVEYIYVNSNTGQSSGGHTAVKFQEMVYHFQVYPDGIFRIVRDSWKEFRYIYTITENRTIYISKIGVSQEVYDKVLDRFNQLYLIQNKNLSLWTSLINDKVLLEIFISGDRTIPLKGLGYFSSYDSKSLAYDSITAGIEKKFGKDFLDRKIRLVDEQLRTYNIQVSEVPQEMQSPGKLKYLKMKTGFSSGYLNLLYMKEALSVIQNRKSLKAGSYFPVDLTLLKETELSSKLRLKLKQFEMELTQRVLSLLGSGRQDSGQALLIALARYLSLKKSIEEEKLYILDCFHSAYILVSKAALKDRKPLVALSKESYGFFELMLEKTIKENSFDEFTYSQLEDAANRNREIQSGLAMIPVRTTFEKLIPLREENADLPPVMTDKPLLEQYWKYAVVQEQKFYDKLRSVYNYHLIKKNCVTELLMALQEPFGPGKEGIQKALGGEVDVYRSLAFIPFYSSYSVNQNLRVEEKLEKESFRIHYLKSEYKKNNPLLTYLKESFAPTSSIYKYSPDESFFLFFTDDSVYFRPIFGIFNLLAGAAETVYGVAKLPFDRGDTFLNGIRGMFFSMPELIFFNIRKGSFLNVEKKLLPAELQN